MNGRLENDIRIENSILNILNDLPEYVEEWYNNLKASNKQMSTCIDFLRKIRRFLIFINPDVKSISPEDITYNLTTKYFISIQKRNCNNEIIYTSDSYQQSIWICLNNFMSFMVKRKYMKENHMLSINKPKNSDLVRINEHRILLTKSDFNDILSSIENGAGSDKARSFQKHMKERDLAIMLIFMTTGMRRTALASINVNDIDYQKGLLTVIDKGDKIQTYFLNDKTFNAINIWLQKRKEIFSSSNALFISNDGNRLTGNAIYKLVVKYCDDALGYKISPHKIRAGFCSILYNETNDAEFVRRAVGHSNIQTTQRYIVTDNSEREKASKIIGNIF